jgi:hypothetical protein
MGIFGWFTRNDTMAIYAKINNQWKQVINIGVKDSVFNNVIKGYVNVEG